MQSTGHSSTQARSFTSMQGSVIVYVIGFSPFPPCRPWKWSLPRRCGGREHASTGGSVSTEVPELSKRRALGSPRRIVLKAQEVNLVRLSVCVTVDVPTTEFSAIEEACLAAGREAAAKAMVQAVRRLEAGRGPRARRARHGRRRTILTRAGYITITRGRARRADGTRYFPLDERLGLPPHHESSPAVRHRGCHL